MGQGVDISACLSTSRAFEEFRHLPFCASFACLVVTAAPTPRGKKKWERAWPVRKRRCCGKREKAKKDAEECARKEIMQGQKKTAGFADDMSSLYCTQSTYRTFEDRFSS